MRMDVCFLGYTIGNHRHTPYYALLGAYSHSARHQTASSIAGGGRLDGGPLDNPTKFCTSPCQSSQPCSRGLLPKEGLSLSSCPSRLQRRRHRSTITRPLFRLAQHIPTPERVRFRHLSRLYSKKKDLKPPSLVYPPEPPRFAPATPIVRPIYPRHQATLDRSFDITTLYTTFEYHHRQSAGPPG